jgi:hypothetical protein
MNLEEEVQEFRAHTKRLTIEDRRIEIVTLEDYVIRVEVETSGFFVVWASIEIEQNNFDDMAQLLTTLSPKYRESFSQALFSKLMSLS